MKAKSIPAKEFDRRFDDGEDMSEFMDLSSVKRINLETRPIGINLPAWLIRKLDGEAARLGIARAALINVLLAQRFDEQEKQPA